MGLFKRAMVAGMSHELTRRGIVAWPSKQAEEEAVDAIADSFEEEEIPETTDETGLTAEEAEAVLDKIVEVAEAIEEKTGGAKDLELNKTAASMEYTDAASYTALRLMEKAAEETAVPTGPDVPGTTTPSPDNSATAEGEIDEVNNPSSAIVGEQGRTSLDTSPGAVGKEEPQVQEPGAVASPPTGEVAKLSSVLDSLRKHAAAMDGASLSGGATAGTPPTPRKDLDDNLVIPQAVAPAQGTSVQPQPAAANVGMTMRQPAGTPDVTAPTNNEPAKDAIKKAAEALRATPGGRRVLNKLAQEAQLAAAQDEAAQEQMAANALLGLANAFQ